MKILELKRQDQWINLPLNRRQYAVAQIDNLIQRESPDRFWYSQDQDGENTQEMVILLPYGSDTYYEVHLCTTQLKALRLLANEAGYVDGSPTLPQGILNQVGIIAEESFEIIEAHNAGILYEAVIDVPGLTHKVVDEHLLGFMQRECVPPHPQKTNPIHLVTRLMRAQEAGLLAEHYPLRSRCI